MLKVVPTQKDTDTRALMSDTKFYESYSRWDEEKQRYETWDESVARVMNMHRSYYKDVMTDELSQLIDEAESLYKLKYALGAQRALQFGGDQLLKHQMRMYNCFDRDTTFLTRQGIKSFNDFEDGDSVVVKTHTGKWQNATVRSYGQQQLYDITLSRKGATKTVKATRDHRWILKGGDQTTHLAVGDKLETISDTRIEDFNWPDASFDQKLMWCYGYVFGDGTVSNNGAGRKYSYVRLCDKDSRFENRFVEMGFKTSRSLTVDGDVFVYTGSYQKTLPTVEETEENLVAFVRGFLEADGEKASTYWTDTGRSFSNIYQVSDHAKEFIRRVFPLAGAWVISERDWSVEEVYTTLSDKQYKRVGTTFGLTTTYGTPGSAYWTVIDIQSANTDTVWCLEVENDQSFILEGGILTGNCTSSYADRVEFFGEIFYILLCGAGAGFSVQKHHVAKLPKIAERKKQAKVYVPEDSIEGWANCLDVLLSSFFVGGGKHPEYEGRRVYFDLSSIRPRGSMISGGFKAPGPEPLRKALDKIEYLLQGLVLRGVDTLDPIHVYDITMHAADAVLAGGVRRSATICLFSPDDEAMAKAKTGNWFRDNPQRGRSNNSAVIVRDQCTKEQFVDIMQNVRQFGEPGFYFVESTEHTTNPCVEIGMFPQFDGVSGWQGCNLTEINGAKANTPEEFYKACRAAAIMGTLQAGYTDFKFLSDTTKKIFDREALLGVSVTGWMNNPDVLLDPDTMQKGAGIVLDVNEEVAKLIGINPAARATCVKPAGNASVLLMTASGVHGDHAPRFLRSMEMNKESEVVQLIKETNPYMIEDSVWSANQTDYKVFFPVISPEGSIFKDDLLGVEQLKKVQMIQANWVEGGTRKERCVDPSLRHNVSNTITVAPHMWKQVEDYLYDNRQFFAGVSFLPASGDKDFNQAPFTEVLTEKQIVEKYGTAALFASGLIVDTYSAGFSNLWDAVFDAKGGVDRKGELSDLRAEWIRRFHKFATNYFAGDLNETESCLKDVYLLHKWTKIQQNLKPVDFKTQLTSKKYTEVDTMGAAACYAGACEI